MTSLFSPFDFFFFSKNFLSFMLLSFIFGLLPSFLGGSKSSFNFLISYLSNFFYSLKSKSMNKSSIFFFFGIFYFLFILNMFSVFSFNFPFTSQVNLALWLSLSVWLSLFSFTIKRSLSKFLSHLIPEGSPMLLVPFLFLIELVSSSIRPFTLMVRLVANILAGHLLMILLSNLIFNFYYFYPLYVLLNLVELFVSLIQAYIFSTMLVLYFSEV